MKSIARVIPSWRRILTIATLYVLWSGASFAQKNIMVNLAPIDGIAITPDNIFNYYVRCSGSGSVQVRGEIRYRGSNLSASYTCSVMLKDGLNMLGQSSIHPQWQFSDPALRDLFFNYKTLPEGTYEYCVTVSPANSSSEMDHGNGEECMYHSGGQSFLINLIDPEDKAHVHEFNPLLSWIANCSFSNELTYRLKVAEVKQGQNAVNAIMRNQMFCDERNLATNSLVYPFAGRPLEAGKWYAWTVDAYFKGLYLGGAETWQFIIDKDTPSVSYPANRSYIDIRRENGAAQLYILGEMKLKYQLDKRSKDVLSLSLQTDRGEPVALKPEKLTATYGDNRFKLNLQEGCSLKHLKDYKLVIHSQTGEVYYLPFKYLNPDFQQ